MMKQLSIVLFFVFGGLLSFSNLNAQKTPAVKAADQITASNNHVVACDACTRIQPTQILTSTKNAVKIFGPPDSKGDPVEYQVFTQNEDRSWKLVAAGQVSKPGDQVVHKYYKPTQLMVLLYCKTPFGDMATFTNMRVAQPGKTAAGPCTDCPCERCSYPVPTGIYSAKVNGVTVTRLEEEATGALEYHVYTQEKGGIWKVEKSSIIQRKGEPATSCYQDPFQMMVLVYDKKAANIGVTFAPIPCTK